MTMMFVFVLWHFFGSGTSSAALHSQTLLLTTRPTMCSPTVEPNRAPQLAAASLGLLLLASSLTLPYQPSRREALGCDALCYGSLTSARSLLSLLGSAIVGRLSDLWSRRWILAVGVLAAAGTLWGTHRATQASHLWWALVPSVLQQNMTVLKAVLASCPTIKQEQAAGLLGMSAGLSMMVGPFAGVSLLQDETQATWMGLVCLAGSLACILQLPATNRVATKKKDDNLKKSSVWNLAGPLQSPAARFLVVVRLLSALAFNIYQTIWTLALRERFAFGPADYGRFFSVVGFFFAVSQGFVAQRVLQWLGGHRSRLLVGALTTIAACRWCAFQTTYVPLVYGLFATMVTAYGVSSTILSADASQSAPSSELGAFFGILGAVESGAGMAGPLLGGWLAKMQPEAPLWATLALNGCTIVLVGRYYDRWMKVKKS